MKDKIIKKLGKIYWDDDSTEWLLKGRIGDIWIKASSCKGIRYCKDNEFNVIIEVDMQCFTDSEIIIADSIDELKSKISEYVAEYLIKTYFDLS